MFVWYGGMWLPTHLKSFQVIQSKCLCSATSTPWYISHLQIHSDLGVLYLAEHIRSIAQSFYSMLPNAENPQVRQLGRYLAYPRDVWKLFKTAWGYRGLLTPAKHALHLLGLLRKQVTESLLVWQLNGLTPTQEMSAQAFSPDGVSLIVEAFSWNDPNCWAHNPEILKPNSDQDQSPPLCCSD